MCPRPPRRPCCWTAAVTSARPRAVSTGSRRPARCGASRIRGSGGTAPCGPSEGPGADRGSAARKSRPSGSPVRCTGWSRSTVTTRVLRPAILWNDQRTEAECDLIRETLGRDRLIATTGNDALTGFHGPEAPVGAQQRARGVVRDRAHRAAEGLRPAPIDRRPRGRPGGRRPGRCCSTWRARLVGRGPRGARDRSGVAPDRRTRGRRSRASISAEAAEATGLRAGTPVVAGGGDQAAAAVGVGAVEPGVVSLSLGTSGVVFATTDGPLIDPAGRLHSFCHAVPGRWHVMGVMLSAAGSLRWYRDAIAPGVGFATLVDEANDVPPGSDGLLFLPYLTGERTPYPDPRARGGIRRAHRPPRPAAPHAVGPRGRRVRTAGLARADASPSAWTGSPRYGRPAAGARAGCGGRSWPTCSAPPSSRRRASRAPPRGRRCSRRRRRLVRNRGRRVSAGRGARGTGRALAIARGVSRAVCPYRALYPALAPTFHSIG